MDTHEIGSKLRYAREQKGLSQEDIADALGIGQSTIGRIENGEFKRIPGGLYQYASYVGLTVEELGLAEVGGATVHVPVARVPALPPVADIYGAKDFPIYAAAEGGPGEILRSVEAVDWWPRPIEVQKVKGAYGMYIVGESMVPEFRPGHVAVINPNLPHIADRSYIFYAETEDGAVRATVKFLRKQTGDGWHVMQHNPPAGQKSDFVLSKKLWKVAHRIVGRQDPA